MNKYKVLTQLGDGMIENYDRDDYDTNKLVHGLMKCLLISV
ncbi:hypothetical protein [Paraclostridium bifermentans]|nr:hypothetical protein [Paraclostridium bifermentans]